MLSSNKIPPPTNVMRLTGKLPQTRCIKLIKNERRRRIDYSRYTKCDKIITGYVRFLCYSKLHKSPVFVTQTEIKYFKLSNNPMERTNRHTQRKKWKKCKFGIVFFLLSFSRPAATKCDYFVANLGEGAKGNMCNILHI